MTANKRSADASLSASKPVDPSVIEIPIRLDRDEFAFYSRVARASGTTINAVLCVVLALSVTKTKPLRFAFPRKKAAKK